MRTASFMFVIASLGACSAPTPASLGQQSSAVVYASDDRQEVYELAPESPFRRSAASVAAVVPRSNLSYAANGSITLRGYTPAETLGLCEDEPFAQQVSSAECTAFLIDDNLLASAGHCFKHAADCANYVFVFGYYFGSPEESLEIDPRDVFTCTRTRVHEVDQIQRPFLRDYAIIELASHVGHLEPLPIREAAPEAGELVSVIGAGDGLPLKVQMDAQVLSTRSHAGDYFTLDSDTFEGASGGPVLDADGAALGIFARGNADYTLDSASDCMRINILSPPDITGDEGEAALTGDFTSRALLGEEASVLWPAVQALCDSGYPSQRLCGIAPRCGDAICSPGESAVDCLEDCPLPTRGPVAPMQAADADEAPTVSARDKRKTQTSGGCSLSRLPSRDGSLLLVFVLVSLALYWRRAGGRPAKLTRQLCSCGHTRS